MSDELMILGLLGGFVLLMLAYGLAKASLMRDVGRYLAPFKCCGSSDQPCRTFEESCKNPANYAARR